MLIKHSRLFDEGDAGGSGEGTGGETGGKPGEAGEGGSKGGTGEPQKVTLPDSVDGWNKFYTEQKTAWDKQITDNKKTIGDQGNEIGGLRKNAELGESLNNGMESNPEKMLEALAKDYNLNIKFDDGKTGTEGEDIKSIFSAMKDGSMDAGDAASKFEKIMTDKVENQTNTANAPILKAMIEQNMANKYDDWDKLADERKTMGLQMNAMPTNEIAHLLYRIKKMPDITNEAEQRGYDKAMSDISKKIREGHSPGGSYKPTPKEKTDGKQDVQNVLKILTSKRKTG